MGNQMAPTESVACSVVKPSGMAQDEELGADGVADEQRREEDRAEVDVEPLPAGEVEHAPAA